MLKKKFSCLAIIPAREGSKRLKNKNIKTFKNKPLIYWSIKSAKDSKYINKILVTSNSQKIISISKNLKIDFAIKRPAYLSGSKADTWDVVKHSINELKKKKILFDYIILLQPTSPLRTGRDIDECFEKLRTNSNGIISINKSPKPLNWFAELNRKKNFASFKKGLTQYKKKPINNTYVINGAIYIFKIRALFKKNFFFKSIQTHIMKYEKSIDIDTQIEFDIAEFIARRKK